MHQLVNKTLIKLCIVVRRGNPRQSLKSKGETETLNQELEIRLSHMQIQDMPQSTLLK